MDDPRSELESMLSSSIDAELPFALERKYVPHHVWAFWFGLPNWLPNSDARANVSVYIFALACFHLIFLVLVGGWGVSFLVIRSDKIRSDQVRSGQVRPGQIRADQVRAGRCATFGMTLGSLWADVWTTLEYFWDEFGITLG